MSKKRTVISAKQMPTHYPFISTAVVWFVLDRFKTPGWVWGIVGTLVVIYWSIIIYALFTEEQVELEFPTPSKDVE